MKGSKAIARYPLLSGCWSVYWRHDKGQCCINTCARPCIKGNYKIASVMMNKCTTIGLREQSELTSQKESQISKPIIYTSNSPLFPTSPTPTARLFPIQPTALPTACATPPKKTPFNTASPSAFAHTPASCNLSFQISFSLLLSSSNFFAALPAPSWWKPVLRSPVSSS